MSKAQELNEACNAFQAALNADAKGAGRVSLIVPKGATLYARVNYARDDARRMVHA